MSLPQPGPANAPSVAFTRSARERLLHTAMRAFAARGFDGVTVRDLAQEAGVNVAAVNYHFGSKEDLHQAVMAAALSEWTSETVVIEDMTTHEPLAAVVGMIMSALIAPVIERQSHPLLVRLIAWDILQSPGRDGGMAAGCCDLIARMLKPHLPQDVTSEQTGLAARWLVSQCLMLSPALATQPGRGGIDIIASETLAGVVARMALGGLHAWLAQLQRLPPQD
jgi:AcrR family transcriptional regulator